MQTPPLTEDSYAEPLDHYDEHTDAPRGINPLVLLVILTAVGFIGYIIFDGFKSETYFYEVDQAVAQGPDLVGQTVRIKGVVEPGSVGGAAGELGRTFRLAHKGKTIAVSYDRALPDTFQENREVVAQGDVDEHYVLKADEVLVKCPSRYEGAAPTATEQSPQAKMQ